MIAKTAGLWVGGACLSVTLLGGCSSGEKAQAQRLYEHGQRQYLEGDNDAAIDRFTDAIALQPGLAEAYHRRARAHAAKGDHDRAIADELEVLRIDPDHTEAMAMLGVSYLLVGDERKARHYWEQALSRKEHLDSDTEAIVRRWLSQLE